MKFQTINPYNNQVLKEYTLLNESELSDRVDKAEKGFHEWRNWSFEQRAAVLQKAAEILLKNTEQYTQTITQEMGKPISEARAEVKKCAWVCEYYAEHAAKFLSSKTIETDAEESFVSYEPLGAILAIMPWNFPFWQVFRYAAPTLMAGNVGLLKHASNVMGSAIFIEEVFREAGVPEGVFQNLIISHEHIGKLLEHPFVKAVTLTGSEKAGASVAALAGKNTKKSLLELGGSNAFIVLADADVELAAEVAVKARFMNTGQSCIAAKRFIVVQEVYDQFLELFQTKVALLRSVNPLSDDCEIGTLAKSEFAESLHKQVKASIDMGAKLLMGGEYKDAYYAPTILTEVRAEMPVFQEETFGPVASICMVKTVEEAFKVACYTTFGLGISIFTRDVQKVKDYIKLVPDGAFFVNDLVKSDPRLPFGGTGKSGYGRELAREGILEFVNVKTVYIK